MLIEAVILLSCLSLRKDNNTDCIGPKEPPPPLFFALIGLISLVQALAIAKT